MSKVFVAQKSTRFDMKPAEAIGTVEYCTGEFSSPFNAEGMSQEILQTLTEKGFDPEVDFIALTGAVIPVALLTAVALATYPKVRLLMYDARSGSYTERTLPRPALPCVECRVCGKPLASPEDEAKHPENSEVCAPDHWCFDKCWGGCS